AYERTWNLSESFPRADRGLKAAIKAAPAADQHAKPVRQANILFAFDGVQPTIDRFNAIQSLVLEPFYLVFGVLITQLHLVGMCKDGHAPGFTDQFYRVSRG